MCFPRAAYNADIDKKNNVPMNSKIKGLLVCSVKIESTRKLEIHGYGGFD